MDFRGKVVLVTGASSGIGATTAEVFAKRGANVVLVGRNIENLKVCEKKCKTINSNVQTFIIQADVTVDGEKVISETINKFKRLDVLINNAGIFRLTTFMEADVHELDLLWNTNLRSVHILTQFAVPHLLKSKGNIVNVSSIAGLRSYPSFFNYCITKAALDQFTKCLSQDLAPKNVRVNSVNPGVIDTNIFVTGGMQGKQHDTFLTEQIKSHPMGRIGNVYEVANTIAFLASDEASFITGSLLPIDGGRVIASI